LSGGVRVFLTEKVDVVKLPLNIKGENMEDYQNRVVVEKSSLDEKIAGLRGLG
jgi:hypothetical protein